MFCSDCSVVNREDLFHQLSELIYDANEMSTSEIIEELLVIRGQLSGLKNSQVSSKRYLPKAKSYKLA
ncbi:MAG: hypothetical protein ACFBSC_17430 [Microcoleaceae cyanobacterium]